MAVACCIGWADGAAAQSFFATLVTDPVVGVDRGSASQIRKLDEPTTFLTFSNTGSEDAGRLVAGFGHARPDLFLPGDQLDTAAVWAGPPEEGWRELLAGGVAYRFPVTDGVTGFVNYDFGDVILGSAEALALDVRGSRAQLAVGLRRETDLGKTATLRYGAELVARRVQSEVMGSPVIDEDIRTLHAYVLYTKGIPYLFQQRLALSVTKGFDALGASPTGNPFGSVPGAATSFLRVSGAAEASVPLSRFWTVNAGLIGQWTEDSLPASQRCGFETNAYARAFDYALVAGDRCIGTRVELAANFQVPDFRAADLRATQGFVGIDRGYIENVGNALSPGGEDTWSSLSVGVRTLQGNTIAEVAATRVLDRPEVAATQDRHRLWARVGIQF